MMTRVIESTNGSHCRYSTEKSAYLSFFSSSHLDQMLLFLLFPKILSPLPSPFDNSTHYLSFTEVFIKDSFLTVSIFQLIQVVWIETGSTFDAIVEDVHKNIMTGVYIFL